MNAKKQSRPAPFVKGRIAPSQIKAIHAVIGKLGIDDENYRHILHSRYGATSCKDLTWRQAEELLGTLNGSRGDRSVAPTRNGLKYTDMDGRPGFASGAQLRLIDAMWSQVARAEAGESRDKALNGFVLRIAKVSALRMVTSDHVKIIVKALEAMGAEHKDKGVTSC